MRIFFPIFEEAGMTLQPIPLNCLIYEEHFIIFFISVYSKQSIFAKNDRDNRQNFYVDSLFLEMA
jgi:hypothetical protein